MKRIFCLLLALVMTLSFTACGDPPDTAPTPSPDTTGCEKGEHELTVQVSVPATCINDGYTLYSCVCGINVWEAIPADESLHSWERVETGSMSVVSDGFIYECCSICGERRVSKYGKQVHSHHGGNLICDYGNPPTCTECGYYVNHCEQCEEPLYLVLEPLGHDYISSVVMGDGCRATITYTCTRCGDTFERDAAFAHLFDEEQEVLLPTCVQEGSAKGKCALCGEECSWVLPAYGHQYKFESCEDTSCTECPVAVLECVLCGDRIERTYPAHGHVYQIEAEQLPTCVEDGSYIMKCDFCGDTLETALHATGEHDWRWANNTGSCTVLGYATRECIVCGKTENIPNTRYTHSYGKNITDTIYPTCTESGVEKGKCEICGADYELTIEPLGHDFHAINEEGTCSTHASCQTPQYLTMECTRCGEREEIILCDQLPHMFAADGEITVSPHVCGEPILETRRCELCGAEAEEENGVWEHDWQPTGKTYTKETTTEMPVYNEYDVVRDDGTYNHITELIGYEPVFTTKTSYEYECSFCHETKWG